MIARAGRAEPVFAPGTTPEISFTGLVQIARPVFGAA
jgi:hypothetical protein